MVSLVEQTTPPIRKRPKRKPWTSAENRILEHYARAVVAGRYPTAVAAVPHCHAALAGRHSTVSVKVRLQRCARAMGRAGNARWSAEEKAIVDRFARAIIKGTYRSVSSALPEFQRALQEVAPGVRRTDTATAWVLLCRAYDFGRPRWKHLWTNEELRLLERPVLALVRGRCPDIQTAVRRYRAACERVGLAVRHPDSSIEARISTRAHALGFHPKPGPAEFRIIARFSRAVAQGRFSHGRSAVPDCLRALRHAGLLWRASEERLAALINVGARERGWKKYEGKAGQFPHS